MCVSIFFARVPWQIEIHTLLQLSFKSIYHFKNNHFVFIYLEEGIKDVNSHGRNVRCFLATTVGYQHEIILRAEFKPRRISVGIYIYH